MQMIMFRKSYAGMALLTIAFSFAVLSDAISQTTAPKETGAKKKPPPAPAAGKQDSGAANARGVQRAKITPEDKSVFEQEVRSAIIVAPSYRDSGLATLRYTFADAVELKAELERQGYTVRMIPSTEATSDGIRQTLTNQKTFLDGTSNSTLVFAFMGHGFQDGSGQNYLMTYGADLNNMHKEALSVDEVQKLILASGARRKVIFIDACRNDPGTRDAEKPRTMAEFMNAEGTAMLLATRPGAFSYEDAELSHGVFTYFLLEGFRGKAAGKDGYVTFRDLSDYVDRSVQTYSMKKDRAQRPLASLRDVGGDFLLATAAPPNPDEIKPIAGASEITSDAIVMKAVGINHSFFVNLNESSLMLLDATNGQPFAVLTEHPEQLKDAAEAGKRTLRWFSGDGPDKTAVHTVVEMKENKMATLWGRIGKPCPDGRPCSVNPYPLLPGEVRDQKSTAIAMTKKGATAVKQGVGRLFNRSAATATETVVNSSTAVQELGLAADSRDKFVWTTFDLVNTARVSARVQR
jgi:uncharacterized caspase-like protein